MIVLKGPEARLSPADLEEVEQRFGFTFPVELRTLYLRCNGGRPETDRFTDEQGTCIVDEFLPIRYGKKALTLEATIQDVKVNRSLLPEHFIPFAVDPGGNFYCFSSREGDFGSVCLYSMDSYGDPVYHLTSSVGEFLSGLTVKK